MPDSLHELPEEGERMTQVTPKDSLDVRPLDAREWGRRIVRVLAYAAAVALPTVLLVSVFVASFRDSLWALLDVSGPASDGEMVVGLGVLLLWIGSLLILRVTRRPPAN